MVSKKLTIVFVHQDGLITGSAISLKNMIAGLNNLKHKLIVVIPQIGDAAKIWEEAGAEVHVVPFTSFWTSPGPNCISRGWIKQIKALFINKRLKEKILSFNPDIIHINDKAALQAGVSLKSSKIPIIQHSRSAYHLTACKLNSWISARAISKYANHIICISEDEIQGFEELSNKTILYNTVDLATAERAKQKKHITRSSLNIGENDLVIGMAENFSIHKGLVEITKIVSKIVEEHPKHAFKFLMVGNVKKDDKVKFDSITEQSSHEFLMNFIKINQLDKYFILAGHQSNPLDFIAAMDILIVAKAHGVVGRQPMEAQAVGTAIIGLNGHSKNSKIVENGVGGYLVDSISDITDKITEILNSPTKLKKLGEAGEYYARVNFNPIKYTQKLLAIYTQILK